ncbi:phosphate butyryltransferase [Fictibacillus macauensis ZFHKF-1]|uniref:Phosphate butyryltransferase n=1 Tax=Fictibacillus macauensis ZFHKF-1 TaxID=1196324 RepID=I8UKG0_9BACL|nr:phosphate butyryltransferase [Fictibacillus macauensis]EIT87313.1 phosphate butyryltransferase [Fictibacillus macauensis ZFHKF-1]
MKLEHVVSAISEQAKKIIAVAHAEDEEVILSVKEAYNLGLASFRLYGDEQAIQRLLHKHELQRSHELEVFPTDAAHASLEAVKAVHFGDAHILMKGHVPTATLMKAVLNKEYGLRTGNVLSHVAVFEVPGYDRLLFITDSGMNIAPDVTQKAQIIENAAAVARGMGVPLPKVAVLAAVETLNPAMSATTDASLLTTMNRRGQLQGCIVDGPLALDNAINLHAAKMKHIDGEVAGRADILMVPSIEVGNVLYKSLVYFAHAKNGGMIAGAKAPIVLTSRSDSAQSKLYSIALAITSLQNESE